jgi:hypothetical protein
MEVSPGSVCLGQDREAELGAEDVANEEAWHRLSGPPYADPRLVSVKSQRRCRAASDLFYTVVKEQRAHERPAELAREQPST